MHKKLIKQTPEFQAGIHFSNPILMDYLNENILLDLC